MNEAKSKSDITRKKVIKFWPCAPDGYLPNSVIRNLIQPKATTEYSSTIKALEEEDNYNNSQEGKLHLKF